MKRFPDSISFSLVKKNSSLPQVYIHRYERFFPPNHQLHSPCFWGRNRIEGWTLSLVLHQQPVAHSTQFFFEIRSVCEQKKRGTRIMKAVFVGDVLGWRSVATRFPFLGVQSCGFQWTSGVDSQEKSHKMKITLEMTTSW